MTGACVTNECAVKIGQILGAQYILIGSIAKIGDLFTMNVRIADVENSAIIKTAAHDYSGDITGLLSTGIRELSFLISDASGKPVPGYQRYSSTGRINITSDNEGVNLVLTGKIPKMIGTLPFDLDQLPPGKYKITLSKVGFADRSRTVEVISMKTTKVFLPLRKDCNEAQRVKESPHMCPACLHPNHRPRLNV